MKSVAVRKPPPAPRLVELVQRARMMNAARLAAVLSLLPVACGADSAAAGAAPVPQWRATRADSKHGALQGWLSPRGFEFLVVYDSKQ